MKKEIKNRKALKHDELKSVVGGAGGGVLGCASVALAFWPIESDSFGEGFSNTYQDCRKEKAPRPTTD